MQEAYVVPFCGYKRRFSQQNVAARRENRRSDLPYYLESAVYFGAAAQPAPMKNLKPRLNRQPSSKPAELTYGFSPVPLPMHLSLARCRRFSLSRRRNNSRAAEEPHTKGAKGAKEIEFVAFEPIQRIETEEAGVDGAGEGLPLRPLRPSREDYFASFGLDERSGVTGICSRTTPAIRVLQPPLNNPKPQPL